MDQFFANLPKPALAIIAIIVGFIIIVAMNPPKTICDSQMLLFRDAQKDFLYSEKMVAGEKKPPPVKQMYETCQGTNSPGGCFELFLRLKKMNADLENVPTQCASDILREPSVKEWLPKSLKLMVQIPWGARGPATVVQKNGWFDSSDLALYCGLSKSASRLMGEEAFAQWREQVLGELPRDPPEDRGQTWSRSLFSVGCRNFR